MKLNQPLKKLLLVLVLPLLILGLAAAALLVQRQGYKAANTENEREISLLDEGEWQDVANKKAGKPGRHARKAMILYDSTEEGSSGVRENVEFVLNTLSVRTKALSESAFDQIPDNITKFDDLIICCSNLSSLDKSRGDLEAWVKNGGHIIFTTSPNPDLLDKGWYSLLGIEEGQELSTIDISSLQIQTDILAGAEDMDFSSDVITGNVLNPVLTGDCTVHITTADEDKIPLLWEHVLDQGKTMVSNADLMESKVSRGVIAAGYCALYPAYAYPVINAAVYNIDDLPSPAPVGYDQNVLNQYGYTIYDFYSNVWMPAMQKLAKDYGLRYSTYTIETYDDNVEGPFDDEENKKTASYYANLILGMGGEVGIHGYNHQPFIPEGFILNKENEGYKPWPSIKNMIASMEQVIRYTESLAKGVEAVAYVAPSNVISREALQELLLQVPHIRVYAGIYSGTSDQMVQEFEVLENGVVNCPRLTADMQMAESEWWTALNELNFHYVESNFIHPDDILDESRSHGGDFHEMLESYRRMVEWNQRQGLRTCTISEAGGAVQRFANLSVNQRIKGNKLVIHVRGLIDEASMMVRTNGKVPGKVTGGSLKKLTDSIYILTVKEDKITIDLEDK